MILSPLPTSLKQRAAIEGVIVGLSVSAVLLLIVDLNYQARTLRALLPGALMGVGWFSLRMAWWQRNGQRRAAEPARTPTPTGLRRARTPRVTPQSRRPMSGSFPSSISGRAGATPDAPGAPNHAFRARSSQRAMLALLPDAKLVNAQDIATSSQAAPDGAANKRVLFHVRRGRWTADEQIVSQVARARLLRLRDSLVANVEQGCTVVRVTSGLGGREGKPYVAAQLAFALAEDETLSVLLVEADVDHPALHEVLDVRAPRGVGLSEQLQRTSQAPSVGAAVYTRLRLANGLDALLEGSERVPAFFDSPQFAALLERERLAYDFVVLNGPVIGDWPDPHALRGVASMFVHVRSSAPEEIEALRAAASMFRDAAAVAVIEIGAAADL